MKHAIRAWAACALLALSFVPTFAIAEAPMVKTQAPGYYRHMLSDFEITALLDGTMKLPVLELLTNAKPDQLGAALQRGYLGEKVETSVNAYLVNTGSKLVLIDTGTGGLMGSAPQLLTNLRAAGYKPVAQGLIFYDLFPIGELPLTSKMRASPHNNEVCSS